MVPCEQVMIQFRRRGHSLALATFTLFVPVVVAACSDASEPLNEPVAPCSGPVEISVARGNPRPTISWTPRCAVALVTVDGPSAILATQFRHWRLESDAPVIIPPLTYGEVPRGAKSAGFVDLSAGLAYRISLFVSGEPPVGAYSWVP